MWQEECGPLPIETWLAELNELIGRCAWLSADAADRAVRRVADHIHLLAGGKIVAHGTPDELARGETPWTRQFFSGEADGPVPFHYPAPDYARQLGLSA